MTKLTDKNKKDLLDIYAELRDMASPIQKGLKTNDEIAEDIHELADRLWSAIPEKFKDGDTLNALPEIFSI